MKTTAPRTHMMLRSRYRTLLRQLLLIILLSMTSAAAWAGTAPNHAKPSLVVIPFDLFDFSLDQRPVTVNALNRWVHDLPLWIKQDLSKSGDLRIIDEAGLRPDLQKLAGDYAHPTACRSCMIELGEQAHADYVLVGQVHKLSNLITYFQIQVDDVHTGRVAYHIDSRADGADNTAMWHHNAHRIAEEIQQSGSLTASHQSAAEASVP
jgi:hypothetical protein